MLAATLLLALLCACKESGQKPSTASGAKSPQLDQARFDLTKLQEDDNQWVMAAKNHANTRFSRLGDINAGNVKDLKVAWTYSTGFVRGHEAAPLVVGGTMYIVTPFPNHLVALDLTKEGAPMKWKYEPQPSPSAQGVACCDVVNRGAAYAEGRIIYNTLDNHTVAVDAETGKELWKTKLGDINKGETMTMAPLVVRDKVFVGNSGGELGVRGWLAALDTKTGAIVWRAYSTGPDADVLIGPHFKPFYEMDRGKDLGVSSWPPEQWKIGGGTVWGWISYDPELDLLYYVLFSMPAVVLASLCLAMDRLIGTHFFNQAEGGDALLYQHLFWFFGHPEVYIIFIPALGILSSVLAVFTRRQIFGYLPVVLSLVATGFIGFGLWVHHMFATGLPQLGQSFFTAASLMVAIPSGVQIFCWLATLWGGRLRLRLPLYWILAFFALFVLGGLSGVMLGAYALDLQVHDTFFVVAHLHYVLIGGAVFPLFGGFYYWFPKFSGRMLSERLGKWHFWLFFIGFNLTFFPLHYLGLMGMPRRVYTYAPDRGWDDLNLLATVGTGILAVSLVLFLVNVFWSRKHGLVAGDNPWDADTLEWATSSPPPPYNFLYPPTVRGRYALWTQSVEQPVVVGLRSDRPEVLVTRLMDAQPDHRLEQPGPTLWPLAASLASGVTFTVSIFTPWGVVIGAVLGLIAMVGWFWPKKPYKEEMIEENP